MGSQDKDWTGETGSPLRKPGLDLWTVTQYAKCSWAGCHAHLSSLGQSISLCRGAACTGVKSCVESVVSGWPCNVRGLRRADRAAVTTIMTHVMEAAHAAHLTLV